MESEFRTVVPLVDKPGCHSRHAVAVIRDTLTGERRMGRPPEAFPPGARCGCHGIVFDALEGVLLFRADRELVLILDKDLLDEFRVGDHIHGLSQKLKANEVTVGCPGFHRTDWVLGKGQAVTEERDTLRRRWDLRLTHSRLFPVYRLNSHPPCPK